MDATTKKLISELQRAKIEQFRATAKVRAIETALRVAGIKPEVQPYNETLYVERQPFEKTTLTEACQQILKDYKGFWLTKSQVEYLVTRGGHRFSAKDSKNSVDVTLRRLYAEGKCEAERIRGSRGNRYKWIPEETKQEKKRSWKDE